MNTEDLVKTVRANVAKTREVEMAKSIQHKIDWSTQASQSNWFMRWLFSLPSRPFTREEAAARIDPMWNALTGYRVSQICDALETALANGLPLKLTAAEVTELRKWL